MDWRTILIVAVVFVVQTVICQNQIDDDTVEINAIDSTTVTSNAALLETNKLDQNLFTADGKPCICLPFYQCTSNNSVITDGAGMIDIRLKQENPCKSYLETCCQLPANGTGPMPTPVPVPTPSDEIHPTPTQPGGCGRRNQDGVGFRIKGDVNNETQFGEYPWMIAVLRHERVNGTISLSVFQCGGSLIHPQIVMTAAHCVAGRDQADLFVRAGEWDTQTKNERFAHVNMGVRDVLVHENYYSGGLFYDVALLVLQNPLNLTDHIDTVCLPPQDTVPNIATCTATGWGKNTFGKEGQYQVILKKVDIPIVPRNICERQLRTTRLGKYFRLHESFICAGGEEGRDACKGDGGGPLVCPIPGVPGRYHQTGIIAWGIDCGTSVPGVYAHVAHFRNWIDQKMRILNFDPLYYSY